MKPLLYPVSPGLLVSAVINKAPNKDRLARKQRREPPPSACQMRKGGELITKRLKLGAK